MSYRRFLGAAQQRLAHAPRRQLDTRSGRMEYADEGTGQAALVSHPLFGGFDVGLGVGRNFLGPDFRLLAPSRFGYLGSALPRGASPADQADTFATLLDELMLDQVPVLGYSAGGPPAIQLALRHPDRVSALVLVASALPGAASRPPEPVARLLFGSNLAFWGLGKLGPRVTAPILGMDRHFRPSARQRPTIEEAWASLFPVAPRKRGVLFDLYVSNPDVQHHRLEQVTVHTLIVSARDDAMSAHDNAVRAAKRMPSARLLPFEDGGHLLLDHEKEVRRAVADLVTA